MFRVLLLLTVFLGGAMFAAIVSAELTIEITSGVDNPTKIAVVPFRRNDASNAAYEDIAAVVHADLNRSGRFEVMPRRDMLSSPASREEIFYRDWSALGTEYVLIGRTKNESGKLVVAYELYDVLAKRRLFAREIKGNFASDRHLAHKISDRVYSELSGIPGAFSSRIMYVSVTGAATENTRYRLLVADADGANPIEILASKYPVLSPTWSPDGKQVAYVSFEQDRPSIYRQELKTRKRERLTDFHGLNSAPAWSPDGKKMAMVLSKDGNPEIYVMDLTTGNLTRITDHYAIDTEPDWMPDGKSLMFTSDRGGSPQIYRVSLADREVKRVTFRGSYNAAADILPDGKSMVMIHKNAGDYHIAWQELTTGRLIVLTRSMLDESPSVAPNGSMLLYATKYRGKGVLAAVAIDGGFKFRLPSPVSEVREPAWSPVY